MSRLAVGVIRLKFKRVGDELRLLDDELYPDVAFDESFGNRLLTLIEKSLTNNQKNYVCITCIREFF
jgi:hypothetical protein